jgi:hypothetical protein
MLTRTTGAIALQPNGNTQGGYYYFMSLTTGKRINRFSWTPLPMPGEVIEKVHILARHNPAGTVIQFGWRDGTPIEDEADEADDAHDEDYLPDSESDSDDDGSYAPASPHPAPGVNEYDDGQAPYNNDNDANDNDANSNEENDAEENEGNDADSNEYSDGKAGDANAENDNDDEDMGSDDNSNPGGGDAYPSETTSGNDGGDPPPAQVATEGVPQVATEGVPQVATEGVPQAATEGVPQAQVATPAVQGTDTPTAGVADGMDEKYGARVRIGLRARQQPRNSTKIKVPQSSAHHVLNVILCEELYGMGGFSDPEHVALTQYNLKKGLQNLWQGCSRCRDQGDEAATRPEDDQASALQGPHDKPKVESTCVPHVHQREEMWNCQGARLCRWKEATAIQNQGRNELPKNGPDRIAATIMCD